MGSPSLFQGIFPTQESNQGLLLLLADSLQAELQGYLRRLYKWWKNEEKHKARERESYIQLNAELQKIARRDKKAFFNEECLIIEENKKGERLEISLGD